MADNQTQTDSVYLPRPPDTSVVTFTASLGGPSSLTPSSVTTPATVNEYSVPGSRPVTLYWVVSLPVKTLTLASRETIRYSATVSFDGVSHSRRTAVERTPPSTTLRLRGASGGTVGVDTAGGTVTQHITTPRPPLKSSLQLCIHVAMSQWLEGGREGRGNSQMTVSWRSSSDTPIGIAVAGLVTVSTHVQFPSSATATLSTVSWRPALLKV